MRAWHPSLSSVLASVLVGAAASAAVAQVQATVEWGCDAPAARTCYFTVLSASGAARSFSLLSGRRILVPDVVPGRDQYFVSLDAPSLGDMTHCRQLIALGHLCQRKVVDLGYND